VFDEGDVCKKIKEYSGGNVRTTIILNIQQKIRPKNAKIMEDPEARRQEEEEEEKKTFAFA
jgi:hypothetical protein